MKRGNGSLNRTANTIRRDVLTMCYTGGAPHIGSSLSVVDILTVLYFHTLRVHPKQPQWGMRDRFILSKGHAVSALYAALARRGFFPATKLKTFFKDGSDLAGHPEVRRLPGIEISSGSLGHGLTIGAGMALAGRINGNPYRVFVLMSDGECDEGVVWEGALFAAHQKLDNLVAVIDYNKLQALGPVSSVVGLEPFADKWRSFGWHVIEADGHDTNALTTAFDDTSKVPGKPTLVLAHTVKGKGVSFMENDYTWHYKNLDTKLYERAIAQLETKS